MIATGRRSRPPVWLIAAALLAGAGAARSAPGDQLDRSSFTASYAEEFDRPATAADFARVYPRLRTNYYFGDTARSGPQSSQFTSRTYGGIRNVMLDALYCPGATALAAADGHLIIEASKLTAADKATCGADRRDFGSGVVTTQGTFAQAFGYFEIRAKLPALSGTWPAFWLLPVDKTRENQGRLAEIDVFEHYGGAQTLVSQGKPMLIDKVGNPFSTVHYLGPDKKEAQATNSRFIEKKPKIRLDEFHTFGVLWSRSDFVFYIDDRETFRTPNPGVVDPHYLVVNLDISEHAGPVPDDLRARLLVDWIRAWRVASP